MALDGRTISFSRLGLDYGSTLSRRLITRGFFSSRVLSGTRGDDWRLWDLRGDITSVEWLEIPKYATPLLAVSYALIGVWGVMAFVSQGDHVYVSQWYILGAFSGSLALRDRPDDDYLVPRRGVIQLSRTGGLRTTCRPVADADGLATAYYPSRRSSGVRSTLLSFCSGFWSLALFYNGLACTT